MNGYSIKPDNFSLFLLWNINTFKKYLKTFKKFLFTKGETTLKQSDIYINIYR